MSYTFINNASAIDTGAMLSNINNLLFIVAIMLGITMIFVCIFAFHLATSISETKYLIKENNEKKAIKKETNSKQKKTK